MSPALLTGVVASEPAGRVLIIDTGARANLPFVEALVGGSWKARNLVLLVYDVTSSTA